MPYTRFTGSLDDCIRRLNGTLEMGPFFKNKGLPVGGLTLIFTAPSATTVTFPGSAGDILTLDEIVDAMTTQLAAVITALGPYDVGPHAQGPGGYDPRVMLYFSHGTTVTIAETGTANALFKLSTTVATTRAPVAFDKVLMFGPADSTSSSFNLVIAP